MCRLSRLLLLILLPVLFAGPALANWHTSLYLGGGGWWPRRMKIHVQNDGDAALAGTPVTIAVGSADGQIPLAGQPAQSVRACNAQGTEMMFALSDPDGRSVAEGPIAAGSQLVIPVECPPRAGVDYYVYFDNPDAQRLPGFLDLPADKPDTSTVRTRVFPVESIELREIGAGAKWLSPAGDSAAEWDHRAAVTVLNMDAKPQGPVVVTVGLERIEARMRGRLVRDSIVVTHTGKRVPHQCVGDQLLLQASLPARSRCWYYIYFSDAPTPSRFAAAGSSPQVGRNKRSAGPAPRSGVPDRQLNLVQNPGFETGNPLPDDWTVTGPAQGPDGVTFGLDAPGRNDLGSRCVKMHVPPRAPQAWRGWRQDVAVQPGRTYLLSVWIKCSDVRNGQIRVHAHRRAANGQLSRQQPLTSIGPDLSGTRDWTLLSGQLTMPEDTTTLELHLTMNCPGTVWHDGVRLTEVAAGRIVHLQGRPRGSEPALSWWQVPAVVKVFPDDLAAGKPAAVAIAAARNEKEPLQLAVRSAKRLTNVHIAVDRPRGPSGFRLSDIRVNVVGYVPIDYPTAYYRSDAPAWHRKVPSGHPRSDGWPGLWPDPLLPQDTFSLSPDHTQPIWITVGIPKEAPAGDYTGRVRLLTDGRELISTPLKVHVWDFGLPDKSHVAAIYDVRLGPGAKRWGKPLSKLYPEIIRFMASRRLCPDTIRPAPTFRYENGKVTADFGAFDKAAEVYFDELQFPFAYSPWNFYLFGWGHPPKEVNGQRPYPGPPPYDGVNRLQLRPEYQHTYQSMLRLFWDHLKDKGWQDRVILYISDEPHDSHDYIRDQMKALCDMIHEVDPKIPIYCSTWKHVPDWDGYLNVWGIGHDGRVAPDRIAQLRAGGARVWFTTDGQMCTDTPYCAVERLLPHYCFQFGAEAYEFWGVAWLTYDPFRFGWHAYIRQSSEPGKSYWVRYPNGDGFLLYPGTAIGRDELVSSIRLEQAREGVEDYEYLYQLRKLVARARTGGRDVALGERALSSAASLVAMPNAGGCQSTKILPDPEKVYRVRRQVAAAIEALEH